MHPIGFVFLVAGLLQAIGAFSGSSIFLAMPHYQKSRRFFSHETAITLHVVFGLIGALIGILILTGVIILPASKSG